MSDEIVKRMKDLALHDYYHAVELEFWDNPDPTRPNAFPAYWRATVMRPSIGGESGVVHGEASTAIKALIACAKAVREHKKKEAEASPPPPRPAAEQRRL